MKTRGRGSVFIGRSGERRRFGRVGHDCGREEGNGDGLIEDSDALPPSQRDARFVFWKRNNNNREISTWRSACKVGAISDPMV